VETALVLPLLLLPPALGVVGVGRVVQAQMGVSAATREAARAASLADSPAEASARGLRRAQEVATGYALRNGSLDLQIEPGTLARGAPVRAAARYEVRMDDLPLLGWITFTVRSDHLERTDAYRSRWPSGGPG
jgi:Flp pilus assembly protein TadG